MLSWELLIHTQRLSFKYPFPSQADQGMFSITSSFVLIISDPFSQSGETRDFCPLLKDNTTKQLFPPISKFPTLSLLTTHERLTLKNNKGEI